MRLQFHPPRVKNDAAAKPNADRHHVGIEPLRRERHGKGESYSVSVSKSVPDPGPRYPAMPIGANTYAPAGAPTGLRSTLIALTVAVLAILWVQPVAAAQDSRQLYRVPAVRVDEAPTLDGVLDEAIWRQASVIDEFVQQEPEEGAPATERTEVLIMYDAENLYLGVRAFDSAPDAIVSTEMRRDSNRILDEDSFQIILDTFNDSRSGYMFVTSPYGAKLEQQIADESQSGRSFGGSSGVNRDWDGVWHVVVGQMEGGWTAEIAIPMVTVRFPDAPRQSWGINFMRNIRRKNEQVFWAPIPQAYDLTRISLAGSLDNLESLSRGMDLRVKPFVVGGGTRSLGGEEDVNSDIGLDVKYGITAGLNLDLTVNTDFAQAEVDDERVNLTRFPLFFPEKREFFLENSGQFDVGATASIRPLADLFFSRRIGLSAGGAHVPILGGARLSGKIGRNNVAILDVQTDEAFGRPGENFFVARYGRDILARSRIGAIVINKELNLFDNSPDSLDSFNRTYGADMTLSPHPALTVSGFLAQTSSPGVEDEDRGGYLNATWRDANWRVYGELADLQDNFNPEVGFVPRRGIKVKKAHFEYNPRPDRFGIRVLEPMINGVFTEDQNGRLLTRQIHNMLGIGFQNGARVILWYNNWFERLDQPFTVVRRPDEDGGDVVIDAGRYKFGDWRFSFNSNRARQVYGSVSYGTAGFFSGTRTDSNVTMGTRLTEQLSAEARYSRNDVRTPGGDFITSVTSFRVDYAMSPTASLRTLTQYNSLSEQWSTAVRLRYTYMPGSDLYIVYDEVRRDATGFVEIQDRQLILKATYLLSR